MRTNLHKDMLALMRREFRAAFLRHSIVGVLARYPRFFTAVFAVAFVCLGVALVSPSYRTNDNVEIIKYAIAGLPIDFMGMGLIGLLHLAYSIMPGFAWYGIVLYSLHALSIYLWLRLIFKVFHPAWQAAVVALISLAYYLEFLVYLDYTATSVMLCTAALTCALLDTIERRPGYLRFLAHGLVFMCGMLVRPQGAIGVFAYSPLLLILVGYVCLRGRPWRSETPRLALIALIFFLPSAVNLLGDAAYRHATMTSEQAQFDAFNQMRGRLDRLSYDRQKEIIYSPRIRGAGHWTWNQTKDFFDWRFLDERVYTPEAMRALLAVLPLLPDQPLSRFMEKFESSLEPGPLLFLLLFPMPFFMSSLRRQPWPAVIGLLLPLYYISVGAFMSVFFGYSERTEGPYLIGFSLGTSIIAGYVAPIELKQTWSRFAGRIAMYATFALIGIWFVMLDLLALDIKMPFMTSAGDIPVAQLYTFLEVGLVACFMTGFIAGRGVARSGGPAGANQCALLAAALLLGLAGAGSRLLELPSKQFITDWQARGLQHVATTLTQHDPDGIIMLEPSGPFRVTALNPLAGGQFPFKTIDLGWNTFSPLFYHQLQYVGKDHGYDLIDGLINNPHAYVLGSRWWEDIMLNQATNRSARNLSVVHVEYLPGHIYLSQYVEAPSTDRASHEVTDRTTHGSKK